MQIPKYNAQILVIDDYPLNREMVRHMLLKMDCEVDLAQSAEEALTYFQETEYDLILTDIMMPDMDGMELTEKIRELEKGGERHTPVVAVTASSTEADREKYLESGLDDLIRKPISFASLASVMDKFLEKIDD